MLMLHPYNGVWFLNFVFNFQKKNPSFHRLEWLDGVFYSRWMFIQIGKLHNKLWIVTEIDLLIVSAINGKSSICIWIGHLSIFFLSIVDCKWSKWDWNMFRTHLKVQRSSDETVFKQSNQRNALFKGKKVLECLPEENRFWKLLHRRNTPHWNSNEWKNDKKRTFSLTDRERHICFHFWKFEILEILCCIRTYTSGYHTGCLQIYKQITIIIKFDCD